MNDSCVPSSLAEGPLLADTDEDLEESMEESCQPPIVESQAMGS
jgi:hypothetical protein